MRAYSRPQRKGFATAGYLSQGKQWPVKLVLTCCQLAGMIDALPEQCAADIRVAIICVMCCRRAETTAGSKPLERLDSHAIVPVERRHAAGVNEDQHMSRVTETSAEGTACHRLCEVWSI